MTNLELIEIAKAIAWPAVVGWGLRYFRDPIVALIPRVTKVGPVSIEPTPRQQENISSSLTAESIAKIRSIVPNELLQEAVDGIDKNIPSDAKINADTTKSYLLHVAAALQIIAVFERIYSFIYGSQLSFLKILNSGPQSIDTAKAIYETAALANPTAYSSFTFERWLGFLNEYFLITPAHGNSPLFQITPRTRGFLRFIVENGYPENKPL
jgi:hypothetical protein